MASSVGHIQRGRFIVVSDPATRDRAARMADEQRVCQARQMEPKAARRLRGRIQRVQDTGVRPR